MESPHLLNKVKQGLFSRLNEEMELREERDKIYKEERKNASIAAAKARARFDVEQTNGVRLTENEGKLEAVQVAKPRTMADKILGSEDERARMRKNLLGG
jgi:hypothetical protein